MTYIEQCFKMSIQTNKQFQRKITICFKFQPTNNPVTAMWDI